MATDSVLYDVRVDFDFPCTVGIGAPGHALDQLPLAGFAAIVLGIACGIAVHSAGAGASRSTRSETTTR